MSTPNPAAPRQAPRGGARKLGTARRFLENALVVGLTGGIGSGKSAAANGFGELGAAIIDADALAHELTAPAGAAMPAIAAVFGAGIVNPDGSLNRPAMRQLAFTDATARARLEGILHPLIRGLSEARSHEALQRGAPYLIQVIPLLVETGAHRDRGDRFDRVLVVDCPEEMQIARVRARNGLSDAEVRRIMAAQATRRERLAAADDVIVNDGDIKGLLRKVGEMHAKYLGLARK